MEAIQLNTKLPQEMIDRNFENIDIFAELMSGLEEALDFENGAARQGTIVRKRNLPDIDVASERKTLNLTQKAFASVLGVSTRTVEAWESGRSNPSPTARNLLYLLSRDHSLVSVLQQGNSVTKQNK